MIEVTGKQISTSKITIKECFGEDMWYSIPDYQRPYVWGEDQITSLLDDIAYATEYTPESQYFLGSLVLHCKKEERHGTKYIENSVLDGQQRLTTLYLLHAVIRDLTEKEKRRKSCAETIFQEGDLDDGIPERLRIEFAIRSEVTQFINQFVKPKGGTLQEEQLKNLGNTSKNASVKNMALAILHIRKWFANEEHLGIDQLYPYLRQYVILIYVASSELDDAFRLFTVLNDRGIKLRNSDILKAHNLKEVPNETAQKEYALFWEDLEGELGEDFDQFLSYIRTIILKDKARNNLLKEFQDNIYDPKVFNKSTKKYERVSPLLKKGSETFELVKLYKAHHDKIFDGNNYNINNNWAFDNLVSVLHDTATSDIWIPPLMAYRRHFGEDHIDEFLVRLDNKFSGDWIAGKTPTNRIEGMNAVLKAIEKYARSQSDLSERIRSLLDSDVFLFNTEAFVYNLEQSTVYGRKFARYILRKLDFLMDAPNYSERRNTYTTMTVEHILPQNPAEGSQWLQHFSEENRETWTHRLGNLVLISRRKNSSQGRLDFAQKQAKYFKHSIETYPNSLRVMVKQSWNLDDLQENHRSLMHLIKSHYIKQPEYQST